MTASILKQDPNTQKVQKNAYLLGHKRKICKSLKIWIFSYSLVMFWLRCPQQQKQSLQEERLIP